MSSTMKGSGGKLKDFSRESLFDLSGKVALVTGMSPHPDSIFRY